MIGFMLARGLGNAAGNALKDKGTDPKDVKPTDTGPVVPVLLVAGLVLVFVLALANGGQVTSAITPIAIIMGFLALGGMLWACFAGARGPSLKDLPDPPPTAQQHTDALRQRVQQLSCPDKRFEVSDMAPFPTMAQVRAEDAAEARLKRVAAIMLDECPTCTAGPAVFCTFHPGQIVHLIDRERSIVVHSSRIGKSVKAGHAKIEDVKAQFDGTIPDDVWKHLI